MSKNQSKAEISQKLFKTLDLLRGTSNITESILFLYGLIILKKITSLTYLVIPKETTWEYLLKESKLDSDHLKRAILTIEKNNQEILGDSISELLFRDLDTIKSSELREVMIALNQQTSSDNEVNVINEILLDRIFNLRTFSMISTPNDIVELIIRLLDLKNEMSLYNPVSSSGELFISAQKYIRRTSDSDNKLKLYGEELNKRTYALCKLNLVINDINSKNILLGDALRKPGFIENGKLQQFDRIAFIPPFGMRLDPKSIDLNMFTFGTTSTTELLFIQHALNSLKNNGIAICIIPNSVLFKSGPDKNVRANILKDNLIDAVIMLPQRLFTHTGINTSLVIFKKKRSITDLLFMDAREECDKSNFQKFTMNSRNIDRIVSTYQNRTQIDGFSKVVTQEEIEKSDFNLIPDAIVNQRLSVYSNKFKRLNVELLKLSDISTNIEIYKPGINSENSVLIPKFASARVYSDLKEIEESKRKNYFVASLSAKHNSSYISKFLNSDSGKELRMITASGFIPSFNSTTVKEIHIYAPGRPKEDEILSNYVMLDSVSSKVEALQDDLFSIQSVEVVTKELKKIITIDPIEYLSNELPFPIASILARTLNEQDPYKKYTLYLNYFEALSIFLTTIQLSGIVNAPIETQEKIKQIVNQKQTFEQWFKNAAFGNWTTILLNIAKQIRSGSDLSEAFCNSQSFIDNLDSKKLLPVLEEISSKRNEKSHSGLGRDEFYQNECVELSQRTIQTGEILLKMFQNTLLVMPKPKSTEYKSGRHHTDSFLLMGSNTNFKVIDCITMNGQLMANNLYLMESDSEKPLKLLPFIQMGATLQSEKNAAYFYNRLDKEAAKYVSYTNTDIGNISIDNSGIAEILEYFSNRDTASNP